MYFLNYKYESNIGRCSVKQRFWMSDIQMKDSSLLRSLSIIYSYSIDTGTCPLTWERSNVVPITKKWQATNK